MHSFLERWYQFRHREQFELWGKPAVKVSVGGAMTDPVAKILEQFCMYNLIQIIGSADGLVAIGCYSEYQTLHSLSWMQKGQHLQG